MNSLEIPLDEKLWLVSEAFIRQYGPVSMHVDSFNAAVEEMIPFIIEEKGKIHLIRNGEEHYTEFSNPYFGKPIYKEDTGDVVKITPKVCMDRSITYASSLYCDIIYKGPNGQINKLIKKHIGDIPIPVYSNLCNLINIKYDFEKLASLQENINDPGGYFLIKGSPKVIVPQVRPSHNNIHIYSGKATSSKGKPRFSKYTETRRGGLTSHITTTQVGICTKSGLISVSIPYIDSHSIPIGIVFRALGAKDEEEMASYIFQKEWFDNHETSQLKEAILILTKSFEQSWKYDTPEAGLYYIGQHSKNIDTISSLSQKDTKEDEKSSLGGAVLKVISYAKHLLSTEFLHHVGIGERFFPEKRIYLGYMVRKLLLCHAGILPTSDRDHVAKKRIHTPGMILAQHFYKTFCQLTGKIVSCMEDDIKKKKPVNISSYITLPHIITKAFSSALSANKWSNTGPPQGISQTLDTFNCISILSFLRKFIIPMANEGGKIEPPRHSHGSQWGFACPWETPEGKRVGLVQNIAMGGLVTVGCDHTPIIDILSSFSKSSPKGYILIKDLVDQNEFLRQTRIFVNGIPQGYTSNPVEIVQELKCMRRRLDINPTISITHDLDDGEIRISTEAGRGMRGLIILDQGNMKLTHDLLDTFKNINSSSQRCGISKEILFSPSEESLWMYLLKNGYVELVDKDEEENLNVAVYPSDLEIMATHTRIQYTHCEMTPDMIEGVGVCTSPKNDCNQAPRNIYQAAMAKQSIGVPGLNHHFYRRGKWHCMVYPQKPIVSTRIRRTLGMDDEPMGQNVTVAVIPWFGLNQEDSLVLNQDAIDRGFMCSYAFVAHEAIIKHSDLPGAQRYETFEIPTREDYNDFRGNTSKLIQDGKWCYTPSGTEVNKGDILIGMTMTYINSGTQHLNQILYSKKKTNISIIYDQKWPATVHSVYCGKNGDGYPCIKLVTRQYRKPVRGDKFSFTHGQKGTAGEIWPSEKMPFLIKQGYTPNILINPLAFPSRMTIGMLIETTLGVAMTASALQSPEYNMPLCLDSPEGRDRKECTTEDSVYNYKEDFNPFTDYNLGLSGDATPFIKSFDIHRVIKAIESMGINGFCEEEMMYNGKRLPALIYNGVAYCQRLKHMVVDKIHARATGRTHAVHRQPTEGRKKKGGFRNGHMERDASSKVSPIALKEGISVTLGSLAKFENVWGWNVKNDLLVKSKQIAHQNTKKILYIITLQDGRKIEASKYHPFYTDKGNYEETYKLITRENVNDESEDDELEVRTEKEMHNGSKWKLVFDDESEEAEKRIVDRLACSLNPPLVDFDADMRLCKGWRWNNKFFSEIEPSFKDCSKYEIFRKSLALARLIGFAITDGHACSSNNDMFIYLGHLLDVDTVKGDIERISGKKLCCVFESNDYGSCYKIRLPINLSKVIRKMGIIKGAKVNQNAIFPNFVDIAPLPILREFLGGLFGGDGHTCCLSLHRGVRDLMKSVSISWTKNADDEKCIGSLQTHMEKLQRLLLRFDIDSTVQSSKTTTDSKKSNGLRNHEELVLNIPLTHLVRFSEKIGFRYCEHKSIRLSAGASYRRFRENVLRQRQEICDKINELSEYSDKKDENHGKIVQLKKYIDEAVEWFENKEPILHKKAIPTSKCAVRIILGGNNDFKGGFQTVEKYFREIGALGLFLDEENPDAKDVTYGIDRNQNGVPAYYLEVVSVRKQEYEVDMCDITVAKTHSYLINGAVSHNCMLAQGAPEMVQDRLLYQSDVYMLPVCQVCGLAAIDDGKNAHCRICQTSKIVMVQLPFGTKLLGQELSVLNFVPRMITLPETPMALKEISLPKSDKNVIKQPVSKTLKITEKPSKLAQSKKVVKK